MQTNEKIKTQKVKNFTVGLHNSFSSRKIPGWDCHETKPTTNVNTFIFENLGAESYARFCDDLKVQYPDRLPECFFQKSFTDDTSNYEHALCDLAIQKYWGDVTEIAQHAAIFLS